MSMTDLAASATELGAGGRSFTVELRHSAMTLTVSPETSLLDAVIEVLPDIPHGCREGYCGACATIVLEGEPDHRDSFLTAEERAASDLMMICVGRSRSERLVLDL